MVTIAFSRLDILADFVDLFASMWLSYCSIPFLFGGSYVGGRTDMLMANDGSPNEWGGATLE